MPETRRPLPLNPGERGFMHPSGCALLLALALGIAAVVALTGCGSLTKTGILRHPNDGVVWPEDRLTHAEAAKQGYTFYGRNQNAWWMQPIVFLDGLRQWEGDGFTTQREENR